MFFQDSILNCRPVINGLFWEYRSPKDNYMNVWLDWTGRQTEKHRETFFMGWSGKYKIGVIYAQHLGYMYHFAGRMNPPVPEPVHDNGLLLTSIGIDLSEKFDFEKMEINAGYSVALEQDRGNSSGWLRSQGLLSELKCEYKGMGILNTLYAGEKQQQFHHLYSQLYWGDQAYRTQKYNRTDLYLYFIRNHFISIKLIYAIHVLEKQMFHEQLLYATFNFDNLPKRKSENYRRFWSNWFNNPNL
jgi:hypothetical protein